MNDKSTSWSERLRFEQVPTAETVATVFGALPIAALYAGDRLDRRVRREELDLLRVEDRLCDLLTDWIDAVRVSSGMAESRPDMHRARIRPVDEQAADIATTEAMLRFNEVLFDDLRTKAKFYIDHEAFTRGKIQASDGSEKAKRFVEFFKDQVALSRSENEVLDHLKGPVLLERYLEHIGERQLLFIQNGLSAMYDRSAAPQR